MLNGTTEMNSSDHQRGWRFWSLQIVPPLVLLIGVGHFNIGTAFVFGPIMLFSFASILAKLVRKQYRTSVRPAIALSIGLIIVWMGNHYAKTSEQFTRDLAVSIQEQCDRDGYCDLPPGDWQQTGQHKDDFTTHSPGAVPFPIELWFNESDAHTQKFVSFMLIRRLEDHKFYAHGGVRKELRFEKQ
jgi:hypothetical protein